MMLCEKFRDPFVDHRAGVCFTESGFAARDVSAVGANDVTFKLSTNVPFN